jgi:anti-anti-sigma factor
VIIDLSGLGHLDSSGLAELIGAHQRAGDLHGRVAIVLGSPAIRRTLEIRGVDGLLVLAGSRAEALAAVRSG